MAITAATKTSDFSGFLHADQAGPIFESARRQSVVQQLARRVPLGINGVEIPVVTGKVTAGWVSEAGQKPASKGSMALKTISPKKLAAIAVVSAEVVRANPGGYMDELRPQIGEAFAIAFDSAALHGTSTPFGANNHLEYSTKAVELGTAAASAGGLHTDVTNGLKLLVNDGKRLTGFAFDDVVEPTFLLSVDSQGRPIYIESPMEDTAPAARQGRLIGRPSFMGAGVAEDVPGTASTAYTVGYGGDWSQAVWGNVGGIAYRVSTEATVTINGTLTSLFENNLVAILAEAEFGWLVNDAESFVKYTETTAA